MSGAGKTRKRTALNATVIKNLKPEPEPYRVPDQLCRGLAIRVAVSGAKTWDCAYRVAKGGPQRRLSLGRFLDVTLEQARARAFELTSAARQGRDLIAEESQARDELTVADLIDRYLAGKVKNRLRSALEIERTLRRVLAPLASKSAASVQRRDLARLTYHVALAFKKAEGDGGDIVACDPREAHSSEQAIRMAGSLAAKQEHCGAIAFSRTGDPALGDFEDAVILKTVGEVDIGLLSV